MEPDQQSTQCPPRRKRETLEMIKCAFCRTAKQKCLPIVRQWPDQKCTRCLEKNLQCSEGQRAMRGKRQSLALTTSVIGPQDQHIVQVHNTPTRIHRRELLAYITAVQSRLPPAYGTYTESSQPPANTADHRMKKQLRDALVLLGLHFMLKLVLQEAKALGDDLSAIFLNDPYRSTSRKDLPGIKSVISTYEDFIRILQGEISRVGSGQELFLEAYASLESDNSQDMAIDGYDALQRDTFTITRFQGRGHYGFAYILQLKRLLDQANVRDDVHYQQLISSQGHFLTEIQEILGWDRLKTRVPNLLRESQHFMPRELLKVHTIMAHIVQLGRPDCLGRSVSHIMSDAGYTNDWSLQHTNHFDALGRSGLYIACQKGDINQVARLINNNADFQRQASNGLAPLHIAAYMGHSDICEGMCRSCIGIFHHFLDGSGRSAILWAALGGHLDTVKSLSNIITSGSLADKVADTSTDQDSFGATALILAVCSGQLPVVQYLLKSNFPATKYLLNSQDLTGGTAFIYAQQGSRSAIMVVLLEAKSAQSSDTNQGRSISQKTEIYNSYLTSFLRLEGDDE